MSRTNRAEGYSDVLSCLSAVLSESSDPILARVPGLPHPGCLKTEIKERVISKYQVMKDIDGVFSSKQKPEDEIRGD
jgi:hypothetical protein